MEKSWMQNEFTGKRVLVAGMARSGVAAAGDRDRSEKCGGAGGCAA